MQGKIVIDVKDYLNIVNGYHAALEETCKLRHRVKVLDERADNLASQLEVTLVRAREAERRAQVGENMKALASDVSVLLEKLKNF